MKVLGYVAAVWLVSYLSIVGYRRFAMAFGGC